MSQQTTGRLTKVGVPPQLRPDLKPRRLLASAEKSDRHPSVLAEAEHRAASIQLRIADTITAFAGSMNFVYLHVAIFAIWMIVFERSPWPTLTLAVSLEAIFLSTFVMIGQNRQAAFQQAKADRDYSEQEGLLVENTELTRTIHELTKQIRDLSQQMHDHIVSNGDSGLTLTQAANGTPPPTPESPAAD